MNSKNFPVRKSEIFPFSVQSGRHSGTPIRLTLREKDNPFKGRAKRKH